MRIVRNTKNLNSNNLQEKLRESDSFEEELKIIDVDQITKNMKEKLNVAIESLAPTKKIQLGMELLI